ncbi:LLM class flavin-dependent oxidoreductase [Rhizorhabdus argentea]|uniref:LLM class flavin-dependent oxidoreductase n=1 Tax=Rhizorhabdus argentea TaxID=1387174 RepID=UPI0030EF9FB2
MEIQLSYNLVSSPTGMRKADLIAAALEQAAWADDKGFDLVELAEHHGSESGYLPSPVLLSASFAACTSNMRICPTIIAPFYDPVRLAEDLCMLDNISDGRLDVIIIGGWVPSEFEMYGVSPDDRGQLIEQTLQVLRCAFDRQPFEFDGRKGRITPPPASPRGPKIFVGGGVKATARRAAQYGDGFFPMTHATGYASLYRDLCAEFGKEPGQVINCPVQNIYLAQDPDRAWDKINTYAMECNNFYTKAAQTTDQSVPQQDVSSSEELRRQGLFPVMTPEECIAYCRAQPDGTRIMVQPSLGGMPPELSWESLELWANAVLPALKKEGA